MSYMKYGATSSEYVETHHDLQAQDELEYPGRSTQRNGVEQQSRQRKQRSNWLVCFDWRVEVAVIADSWYDRYQLMSLLNIHIWSIIDSVARRNSWWPLVAGTTQLRLVWHILSRRLRELRLSYSLSCITMCMSL